MCGLVGLAGDTSLKMRDVFTDLLYVDTLRGHHSTGAALIKRDTNEVLMEKQAIAGPEFIGTKEFKKMMEVHTAKALIGHNRYATIGAKTAENAHPFKFDNVVGAHNGTIDKFALHELDDYWKFGTDSEAVFNSINKIGLKATIEKLTGAWALTFFDHQMNTINLLRNDKRPLFFTYSEDRQTLMWASDADMLAWIMNRHSVKVADNRLYECEPNTHYRWVLPAKFGDVLGKPMVAKVEGFKGVYKPPVHVVQSYHYGAGMTAEDWDDQDPLPGVIKQNFPYVSNHQTRSIAQHQQQQTSKSHTPISTKIKIKLETKRFRPPYKNYKGVVQKKEWFEGLIKNGCLYCDKADQKWGDFIKPLKPDLDGRELYLCESCYNTDDTRELVESTL